MRKGKDPDQAPDPDQEPDPDPYRVPLTNGSDPDPQHCFKQKYVLVLCCAQKYPLSVLFVRRGSRKEKILRLR